MNASSRGETGYGSVHSFNVNPLKTWVVSNTELHWRDYRFTWASQGWRVQSSSDHFVDYFMASSLLSFFFGRYHICKRF